MGGAGRGVEARGKGVERTHRDRHKGDRETDRDRDTETEKVSE